MTRNFTGWHMTAIMIAFFAVVIGVNFVMASSAVRTFGGVVVENSYVASQRFNGWLGEARAQDALGWRAEAWGQPGGQLAVRLTGPDGPIQGAAIVVRAEHPLGRLPGRSFVLRGRDGTYAASHALPAGRWKLRIEAQANGHDAHFAQEVRL